MSAHRLAAKDNARNHVLLNAGNEALTEISDAYRLQSASQRRTMVFDAALLAKLGAPVLPSLPQSRTMMAAAMPPSSAAHSAQSGAPHLPPPPPPLSQAILRASMNAAPGLPNSGAQRLPVLPPLPQATGAGASMPSTSATTAQPPPVALAQPRPTTPAPKSTAAAPSRERATTVVQSRNVDPHTGAALKGTMLERFNANRTVHTPTFSRMANVARFIAAQDGATPLKCLQLSQSESADFGFGFAVMPKPGSNKPLLMSDRERIATYTGIMSILDNTKLRSRVDSLTLAVMDGAMADVMNKLRNNNPVTADDVREAFTLISMDLSIPEADAAQSAAKFGLKELKSLHTALTAAGRKEIRFLPDENAVSGLRLTAIGPKKVVYPIKLNHPDTAVQVYEPVMRSQAGATTHRLFLALLDKWAQDSALTGDSVGAITAAKRSMEVRMDKANAYIRASDVEYAFRKILEDMGSP
jgi:hypothetical protein